MSAGREAKKKETRQRISDTATELFYERGFDAVTLDDVARAAKVSKMTILNYFSRKEELLLDREDDLKLLPLRRALRERPKGQSPVAALRALLEAQDGEKNALMRVHPRSVEWWRIVEESPALKARLHELGDEAAHGLALELGGAKPGAAARLAAGVIVLAVRAAREEAIRAFKKGASAKRANAAFFATMERGLAALEAVLEGP